MQTFILVAIIYLVIRIPRALYMYSILKRLNQPGWSQFLPFYDVYIMGRVAEAPRAALIAIIAEIVLVIIFVAGLYTAATSSVPSFWGYLIIVGLIVYISARVKIQKGFVSKLRAT